MTKSIFGPVEIHDVYLATAKRLGWPVRPENDVPYDQLSETSKALDIAITEHCNAKLQSLGIDSETPEKLKGLELAFRQAQDSANRWYLECCERSKRLAEFEIQLKNREWYIDKLEPQLKELEHANNLLVASSKQVERMIAEAPVVYRNRTAGLAGYAWFDGPSPDDDLDTHKAKLVQIEELK